MSAAVPQCDAAVGQIPRGAGEELGKASSAMGSLHASTTILCGVMVGADVGGS